MYEDMVYTLQFIRFSQVNKCNGMGKKIDLPYIFIDSWSKGNWETVEGITNLEGFAFERDFTILLYFSYQVICPIFYR